MAPSATLAVDARAKALRKAGHDVIGFGAGEPDFPTPAHIVEAAVEACRDPANHHYTPTAGLPELREQIAVKTAQGLGLRGRRFAGPRHERGEAGGIPDICDPLRPGRRGARTLALLDDVSRGHQPGRRSPGPRRDGLCVPHRPGPPRGGVHARHEGPALRVAVQPDRCRRGPPGGRGGRPLGRRPGSVGGHRRDLRAPGLWREAVLLDCPWSFPRSQSAASCSTELRRPMR